MKKNYKSDFDIILTLKTCVRHEDGTCSKRDVGWPEHDWVATFRTENGLREYVASRKGDALVNCFNDNGRIHVVFNNHRLGKGVLRVDFHSEIPNAIYPDGVQDLYEPQRLDIELVDGPGDCAGAAEVEVLLPYIKGDRGEKLTYGDLSAQDKEDLIAPIKESIDEAITEKQDKLSVTADFDLTENILSLTDIGKRRLFDDMWASISGTKLANGNYRMGADGKELTYAEALVRYERNGFIDRWNHRCLIPVVNNKYEKVGQFNELTGYFELNGHVDINYAEALEIDRLYVGITEVDNMSHWFCGQAVRCRTLFPLYSVGWTYLYAHACFRGCRGLKKIRYISVAPPTAVGSGVSRYTIQLSYGGAMFDGCTALETIEARIIFSAKTVDVSTMFRGCSNLKEVFIVPRSSISFSDSPLLSETSMAYMIANSESGITITVHTDVYAKLTGDTTNAAAAALTEEELAQWMAITEAAAAKNISFATV